jgi:hypothetical protein
MEKYKLNNQAIEAVEKLSKENNTQLKSRQARPDKYQGGFFLCVFFSN